MHSLAKRDSFAGGSGSLNVTVFFGACLGPADGSDSGRFFLGMGGGSGMSGSVANTSDISSNDGSGNVRALSRIRIRLK